MWVDSKLPTSIIKAIDPQEFCLGHKRRPFLSYWSDSTLHCSWMLHSSKNFSFLLLPKTFSSLCFASLQRAEILWVGSKLPTSIIKAMLWSTRILSLSKKKTLSFLLNWLYVAVECCTAPKTSLFNFYQIIFLCFASLQWVEILW